LCKFLGKEIPKEPYPNRNSTAEFFNNFPIDDDFGKTAASTVIDQKASS
jgi:hypothetical protein